MHYKIPFTPNEYLNISDKLKTQLSLIILFSFLLTADATRGRTTCCQDKTWREKYRNFYTIYIFHHNSLNKQGIRVVSTKQFSQEVINIIKENLIVKHITKFKTPLQYSTPPTI